MPQEEVKYEPVPVNYPFLAQQQIQDPMGFIDLSSQVYEAKSKISDDHAFSR